MQNTNPVCMLLEHIHFLRRWWVKFTNKVHGDKLHWGWRGLKMQFIIFDHMFLMFLAKGTLLGMFGHRGF